MLPLNNSNQSLVFFNIVFKRSENVIYVKCTHIIPCVITGLHVAIEIQHISAQPLLILLLFLFIIYGFNYWGLFVVVFVCFLAVTKFIWMLLVYCVGGSCA